jgi:hypothetical protein
VFSSSRLSDTAPTRATQGADSAALDGAAVYEDRLRV